MQVQAKRLREGSDIGFGKRRNHEAANPNAFSVELLQPVGHHLGSLRDDRIHIQDLQQINIIEADPKCFLRAFGFERLRRDQQLDLALRHLF